ncbi:MAG TPA: ABC transporter ATP-binding protein [Candidatus Polarisedimenticolaceae bacterium]|nr:ABC transporter ATP-binding protein [Candidatus Polarisedimenticolaceae bacterium]
MSPDEHPAPAIRTENLSKHYGAIHALNRMNLSFEAGESVALFGPNGAGKTTLIRILTLSLRPSSGSFRIAGLDPRRDDLAIRRQIGVISHQSYLYDDLTARQNLEFFAGLYGVDDPRRRTAALLDSVGLAARADDPVRTFSRGMQQRASLARALVHEPQIVFLDEPFTGLDPHGAMTLRDTLERLRQQRRTIVMVTHNLARGLELADRWLILARGRVVDEGRSGEVDRAAFERSYFERLTSTARVREPA